jgi:flavin-dependent dehydrogenase
MTTAKGGLTPERVDAVIVGARCAGSAAATALARAGRSVVCIERAKFPADTLSTHLLFLGGVLELQRLGALDRVLELGPPRLEEASMAWGGYEIRAGYTPVDGLDYSLCVRRPGLDAALAATARDAGAEIREGCQALGCLWDAGRMAGVRCRDADGVDREIRAPLVIGADGRKSLVAREAGVAETPRLFNPNGRGCYFAYWTDGQPELRSRASQWRQGRELVTAFPCDDGLLLVLLMPPVDRAGDFNGDLAGEYMRTALSVPGLAGRLEGAAMVSKVRHTNATGSYFRHSQGPGWALPGDAGHFKDPVTAQGIRDALRFGRLLGESAATVLDDPRALDLALDEWERNRDGECIEMYQWTNRLGRAEEMSPIEAELYRRGSADPELARSFLDVMARTRTPGEVMTPKRVGGLIAGAVRHGEAGGPAVIRRGAADARDAVAEGLERRRFGTGDRLRRNGFRPVPRAA